MRQKSANEQTLGNDSYRPKADVPMRLHTANSGQLARSKQSMASLRSDAERLNLLA